jgi:hypothetical protein
MIDLDFVAQGSDISCTGSERVVVNPQVRRGRVVFVSTKPGSVCGGGGYSWVNALDAIDGSRWAHSPFDINGDGGVDREDLVTSQQEGAIAVSSIRLKPESQAIYSAPSSWTLGADRLSALYPTARATFTNWVNPARQTGGRGYSANRSIHGQESSRTK